MEIKIFHQFIISYFTLEIFIFIFQDISSFLIGMAKRKAIDMKMIFYSHASKTNFHKTEKFCTQPGHISSIHVNLIDIGKKRQMLRAMAWLFCQCKQHSWRKWRKVSYTMRKLGNRRTTAFFFNINNIYFYRLTFICSSSNGCCCCGIVV